MSKVVATIGGETPQDAPEGTEWVVLYHIAPIAQAFKGRGEFLKLLFEDAQVPYHFTNKDMYGAEGWMDMFRDPQKKGAHTTASVLELPKSTVRPYLRGYLTNDCKRCVPITGRCRRDSDL